MSLVELLEKWQKILRLQDWDIIIKFVSPTELKSGREAEILIHRRYKRAYIKVLQAYKKELKAELKTLNQLYYSMNRSKYFNPKSYENKMLQRQIRQRQEDISYVNDSIKNAKEELNYIIKEKDKFYQSIRKHRNEAKN